MNVFLEARFNPETKKLEVAHIITEKETIKSADLNELRCWVDIQHRVNGPLTPIASMYGGGRILSEILGIRRPCILIEKLEPLEKKIYSLEEKVGYLRDYSIGIQPPNRRDVEECNRINKKLFELFTEDKIDIKI